MRRLRVCDRKFATTSKRSSSTPCGRVARAVEQVVDRGDVDAHRELLLVAQERRDLGEHAAVDVDDRLAVALDEHRAREPLDDRGRDLVGGHRGRGGVGFVGPS